MQETELSIALAERDVAREELLQLKEKVGKIANAYAREYDWCSVAKQAVEEAGCHWPEQVYEFTVLVEYTIRATHDGGGEVDEDYIECSISQTQDQPAPTLDADWSDQSILRTEISEITINKTPSD